ncbi:unnamed protein product [Caenorhabditis brenneri]
MSEIFQSNEVDEQVIVETFATLGHKVSKTAWQLQEHLDKAEETLFQTNLNFVPQHFPKQEDPVHITGMANRSTFGSHYLSFEIVSFDDSTWEGILVGAGHSTLVPIHRSLPPSVASQNPRIVQDPIVATPTPPIDVPTSSSNHHRDSRLSADSRSAVIQTAIVQPVVDAVWPESPSTTPVAIVHQNTDPTTTASLSNPPMSSSTAAAATLPGPSILRRPRVGAATLGKRKRHVSFGSNDDDVQKVERFMLINVTTSHPSRQEKLNDILGRIGVRPINTTHEVFPIKKRDRHVFFFDVVGDKMISRVENLMQPRNWAYLFGIRTLLLEDQQPFIVKAIPMSSIIEALFLSQMVGKDRSRSPSSYNLKDDLLEQLADKKHLGKILKDDPMTAEITSYRNPIKKEVENFGKLRLIAPEI